MQASNNIKQVANQIPNQITEQKWFWPVTLGLTALAALVAVPRLRVACASLIESNLNGFRHSLLKGSAEPVTRRSPYDIEVPIAP